MFCPLHVNHIRSDWVKYIHDKRPEKILFFFSTRSVHSDVGDVMWLPACRFHGKLRPTCARASLGILCMSRSSQPAEKFKKQRNETSTWSLSHSQFQAQKSWSCEADPPRTAPLKKKRKETKTPSFTAFYSHGFSPSKHTCGQNHQFPCA